jgi:hypothetical protein
VRLPAGALTDAAALTVVHELVDPDQIVAGSPMSDVEVDEVFVVLAGEATR